MEISKDYFQTIKRDDMFIVVSDDGNKKLHSSITQTSDICRNYSELINNESENKALFFDSICIRPMNNISLIDIGYSPTEKLEIRSIQKKIIYFLLPSFNYTYSCEFFSDSTIFDAEDYFSKEFSTVPQNVYIEYKKQRLSDDEYLFDYKNSKNYPFTISFKKGYQLYYTFLDQFNFICMHEESTLKNLKDFFSSKYMIFSRLLYGERIKRYFDTSDQITIEKSTKRLKDLSREIKIFDFNFNEKNDVEDEILMSFDVRLESQSNSDSIHHPIQGIDSKSSLYLVTCILEHNLQIDRSLFVPYDDQDRKLDLNSRVPESGFIFKIGETLQVKIEGKINELSYLTTINYIKSQYGFANNNFGIVINKHFSIAHDKTYLINCLNNSDDSRRPTEINFKRPIAPCHICSFTSLKTKKKKDFIVPDGLPFDKVVRLYLQKRVDSIEIKEKNISIDEKTHNKSYEFNDKYKIRIDIIFLDESNKHEEFSIDVLNENARVIDLLYAVSLKKGFRKSKVYSTFEAYFGGEKLHYMQRLSSISYSQQNRIKVKSYSYRKNRGDNLIKILDFVNKKTIKIKCENISAKEIIAQVSKKYHLEGNLRLFMYYVQLEPNDHPIICRHEEEDFLILNQVDEKKELTITNGTLLKFSINITFKNYPNAYKLLIGMLNITDFRDLLINFSMDENEYTLPKYFNAGAIPNDSVIIVTSKKKTLDSITFNFKGKNENIKVSNIDLNIDHLKPDIQQKLNKFDVSSDAMQFNFYGFPLDGNNRFTDYGIQDGACLSVCSKKESFSVTVKTQETISSEYKVMPIDTATVLANLIKSRHNYGGNIKLQTKNGRLLANNSRLEPGMVITLHCDRIAIQCQGSLGREEQMISSILSVKEATAYLKIKLDNKNICIFTLDEKTGRYEKVDQNVKLFETNAQLYVHQLFSLKSLQFGESEFIVNITERHGVSEFTSLGVFKKDFISSRIYCNPKNFFLATRKTKLNENLPVYKVFSKNHDQVFVKFLLDDSGSSDSLKPESNKPKSLGIKRFKPKITLISPDQSPKVNSDRMKLATQSLRPMRSKPIALQVDDETSDEDDEEKRPNSQRPKLKPALRSNKNKKKEYSEEEKENDDAKKERSEEEKEKDDAKKERSEEEKENDDAKKERSEEEKEKDDDKKERSEEEKDNDDDKKEKSEEEKEKDDDDKKEKSEEEKENDDDKKEKSEEKEIKSEDEEEIKKIIEEGEEPLIEYKIQIGREEVRTIKIKESATINDMKIQIAKEEGDVDPNCVSILFAGKNLKKNIVIKNLKLEGEDILQVYIRNIEEILLKTAKALQVFKQEDIEEYYSEYEEEDENN